MVGGIAADGVFPSFPAVLDGNPQENIRLTLSTASTCNVFDFETYKRGKLHKEYPYKMSFEPFRPGQDTVSIRSAYGTNPMMIHGRAEIPIEIDETLYMVEAYLVDLHPNVQGFLSLSFLRENKLGLEGTPDGMQKIVAPQN